MKPCFQGEYERQGKNVAFLEYAGGMGLGKCDPCTMQQEEMYKLMELLPEIYPFMPDQGKNSFYSDFGYVTRLHIRYTHEKFPEDLEFRIVGEEFDGFTEAEEISKNARRRVYPTVFQGRYVIRRTKGTTFCLAGFRYRKWNQNWVENLKRFTGWDTKEIEKIASR